MRHFRISKNQQHPPPPPLFCSLDVFWVSVTVLGCLPPLLPPACGFSFLSICDSRSVFASCKKSSSMLSEFLAEVSRNGMSFSFANCLPNSGVISLSVRSLLLPACNRNCTVKSDYTLHVKEQQTVGNVIYKTLQ